jgi:hypothetical protein
MMVGVTCNTCIDGYYIAPDTQACTICPIGSWCSHVTLKNETCATNRTSPLGSDSINNCTCSPGYGLVSMTNTCSACTIGSSKGVAGDNACGACTAGSYTNTIGSLSCTACATGRYGSATGESNSQCTGVCAQGYWCPAGSTNNTAVPCLLGSYSTSTGATSATWYVIIFPSARTLALLTLM